MSEQITANFCLAWMCVLWPGLLFWLGLNVGRDGWRGWWRRVVLRIKSFGPVEDEP